MKYDPYESLIYKELREHSFLQLHVFMSLNKVDRDKEY